MQINGKPANAAIKELKALSSEDASDLHVYKEWQAEAKALEETSNLSHPHMIQVKAIITRGRRHYFMFQWADGGSLRDFYRQTPRPSLEPEFVKEIVHQFIGLSDALNALHNWEEGSYRHGDLKPENILRFEDGTRVGILKIADMGLAKHHVAATVARGPTTSRSGTPSYEPPEVYTKSKEARSRLYDIWSMGCITLELLVWLLYGYDALLQFHSGLKTTMGTPSPYWWLEKRGTRYFPVLHPNVKACIAHISKDPECTRPTAIRDLLSIVETKLLVISLPRDSRTFWGSGFDDTTSSSSGEQAPPGIPTIQLTEHESNTNLIVPEVKPNTFRTKADGLCRALGTIAGKGEESENYWSTGASREGLTGPPTLPIVADGFLSTSDAALPVAQIDRAKEAFPDRTKGRQQPGEQSQQGLHAPSPKSDVGDAVAIRPFDHPK